MSVVACRSKNFDIHALKVIKKMKWLSSSELTITDKVRAWSLEQRSKHLEEKIKMLKS